MVTHRDALVMAERQQALIQAAEREQIKQHAMERGEPHKYEIRVQGELVLDNNWSDWAHETTLTTETNRSGSLITVLIATVTSQTALNCCLNKLYTTGLPILSVNRLPADIKTLTYSTIARFCR